MLKNMSRLGCIALIISMGFASLCAETPSLAGRWVGAFTSSEGPLSFELIVLPKAQGALFSVPAQNLFLYPVAEIHADAEKLDVFVSSQEPRMELRATFAAERLSGDYLRDDQKIADFSLERSSTPARSGQDFTVASGSVRLPGTLTYPAVGTYAGKPPVVLLLADSGPTDRDGNNYSIPGKNDCYAQVATNLTKYGIATLRYDKRGSGEAYLYGRPEKSLVFSQFIDDAAQAIELLRRDGHFGKIIVAGHGEGALVGMVAATKAQADGFISIAGVGVPAWQTIKEQLESLPVEDKTARTAQEQAWTRILTSLRAGKTVAKVPDELQSLFRPSIQPYLISWFSYEPQVEIAKLRCPVLLIQGGNDRKITPADTSALEKGKPSAKEVYVPMMNHVLKDVQPTEEDNYAAYSDSSYPLASGLLGVISDFVKKASGTDNSRSDKE